MTRSALSALVVAALGLFSVATLPAACQSGGIGDPCTPEDEYDSEFPGFKVSQDFIESRSFQCETRICLVNHFQGRVSCPLGQGAPVVCSADASVCTGDSKCTVAAVDTPSCDPEAKDGGASQCSAYGGKCNAKNAFCECSAETGCPKDGYSCNDGKCTKSVCFSGQCQTEADKGNAGAADKACCLPGSTTPVAQSVCGQCAADGKRGSDNSVYCSCRCAPPEGKENDPENVNAKFCECSEGFTCSPIREDIGIGDKLLAGSYCVKTNTEYVAESDCGAVTGNFDAGCSGVQVQ